MKSRKMERLQARLAHWALMVVLVCSAQWLSAQTASRFVGTITAVNGDVLTVKTDAGEMRQVGVPTDASLKRVEPGQRDLSAAITIQLSDLATGDRVLVKLDPEATGPTPQAAQIITIKSADLAMKQQKEREEWQMHGVGGLVKSVDTAGGVIVLTNGAGATAHTVTVHVSKTTVLKRYAPASVRYDLAQPAPMDAIHVGDQLRARGTKNAAGTEMNAEEVVSGSFRNIAGTILSIHEDGSTLEVKDLETKKPVTVHIQPTTQMHQLTEETAKMIAARLKATPAQGTSQAEAARPAPEGGRWRGQTGGGRAWAGQGHAQGGEMQQMLSHAPSITLKELKKGQAVMLVSTEGDKDVTAITLLSGVEPLLEAPAASQNLLSSWSMGSGGAEVAAQ